MSNAKPLIKSQTTSSSESIRTVLQDFDIGDVFIPDYQRDSDQWDLPKKSLLIESIINNFTLPEILICIETGDDYDRREVIDGQQRICTFKEFYSNQLRLIKSDHVSYLGEGSIHYAGKVFNELPNAFKKTFENYKLTITQLPYGLSSHLRLEIFRRINIQDSPLSPQDVRLAYYGGCQSVTFIRLAGIIDPHKYGPKRMIQYANSEYGLQWPWLKFENENRFEWKLWWENKKTSVGQAASEMFLWFIVAKFSKPLNDILTNKKYLNRHLNTNFSGKIEEVADIFCAQLKYESENMNVSRLCGINELQKSIFPSFANWFYTLRCGLQNNIVVNKYRRIAFLMAALSNYSHKKVTDRQMGYLEELIREPRKASQRYNVEIPEAKGKWEGKKGLKAQIITYFHIVDEILK